MIQSYITHIESIWKEDFLKGGTNTSNLRL